MTIASYTGRHMAAILDDFILCPLIDDNSKFQITAKIYGDSRFEPGTIITTGTIRAFSAENNKAKTNRTEYTLGNINKDYHTYISKFGIKLEDWNFGY